MIKSRLSRRKVNLCSIAGDKLDRRLLHISAVIEKRLSTATEPADIPRNKPAIRCNVGKLFQWFLQNSSGFCNSQEHGLVLFTKSKRKTTLSLYLELLIGCSSKLLRALHVINSQWDSAKQHAGSNSLVIIQRCTLENTIQWELLRAVLSTVKKNSRWEVQDRGWELSFVYSLSSKPVHVLAESAAVLERPRE